MLGDTKKWRFSHQDYKKAKDGNLLVTRSFKKDPLCYFMMTSKVDARNNLVLSAESEYSQKNLFREA